MRRAMRLYFYLLGRGVVRPSELCEALSCTQEELREAAHLLMESDIPLREEQGYWLEDDDVFSLILTDEEARMLRDFQRLLRESHPHMLRQLTELILLRAVADDLLRKKGGQVTNQSPERLLQLLVEALEKSHSLVVHFEAEDVKELLIRNILQSDETVRILAEDSSGNILTIGLEEIRLVSHPRRESKQRIRAQLRVDALAELVPYLEEEAQLLPRGKDILLETRSSDPFSLFATMTSLDPQARLL